MLLSSAETTSARWPDWLHYGDETETPEEGILIVRSRFFGKNYGLPSSLPRLPLAEIEGVPLLFGKPLVERRGNALIVHADIIASAYFMLTRYEEWVRSDVRDEYGRFPGKESLPARAGFLDRPIVDEYADLLRGWAREMGIIVPRTHRRFSVLLTHDVDMLSTKRTLLEPFRFLCWREPEDGHAIAAGGIAWDSTMGVRRRGRIPAGGAPSRAFVRSGSSGTAWHRRASTDRHGLHVG